MFTGIVEETGKIKRITSRGEGKRITLNTGDGLIDELAPGDSLAIDGVCLTVEKVGSVLEFSVSSETTTKSTLSTYKVGQVVNLEPALVAGERFGGHFVSGHVDTTGKIEGLTSRGDDYDLRVELPDELSPYVAEKGSIALDGISLTVNSYTSGSLICRVIPHTYENTNMKYKNSGDLLNIEIDMLARYVGNIIEKKNDDENDLSVNELKQAGF